jgi:RNA polymerase sigma-70 factor (ECF subfamily)
MAVGSESPSSRDTAGRPDWEVTRLFDEIHVRLRRYLILLGLSPDDADDGVQEAFLRLHKHVTAGGDRSNLRGWIFQVGRNLARDHRRSRCTQRAAGSDEDLASLHLLATKEDNPEDRFLKQEMLMRLRSALERLSPQQAECFELRASGLRYREIADVMGIGISAVGELVERATSRLSGDFNGET